MFEIFSLLLLTIFVFTSCVLLERSRCDYGEARAALEPAKRSRRAACDVKVGRHSYVLAWRELGAPIE